MGFKCIKKKILINEDKHKIIVSSHPSGLSCYKKLKNYGEFINTDHFKFINNNIKSKLIFN